MGERADVTVTVVSDVDAAASVVDLFGRVWATGTGPLVRRELAWALAASGAYVSRAVLDDTVVGASLGWLGIEDGRPLLHSHLTGVEPGLRGTGVGLALKRHQRSWCLERGIDEIRWTFDPLVRRNAWFNLTKLGAAVVRYEVDFYGPLDDSINAGEESDRVVVSWDLAGPAAVAAAAGTLETPDADALRDDGAVVVLGADSDGAPRAGDPPTAGVPAVCATPADIEALRGERPDVAGSWRRALRAGLGSALDGGWRAVGISANGWYVLEPPERSA